MFSYATDIIFICLMTCVDNSPSWGLLRYAPEAEWISLIYVDNKPLKRCKISIGRTSEQCEDAYWGNYMLVLVYMAMLSTDLFYLRQFA